MSRKNLILLSIIFLLLIAVVFKQLFNFDRNIKWKADGRPVEKIELTIKSSNYFLVKDKDKAWRLEPGSYLADEGAVNSMLDTLTNKRSFELVSAAPADFEYELDPASQAKVILFTGGKEMRSIEIGMAASTSRHTYVRVAGDKSVYMTEGNFSPTFRREIADLRSKAVFSFNTEDLVSLTLERGTSVSIITRDQVLPKISADTNAPAPMPVKYWKDDKGRRLSEALVNDIVNTLGSLSALSFIDSPSPAELAKEKKTARILVKTHKSIAAITLLDKKDGDNYRALIDGRECGFVLPEGIGKRLDVRADTLIEK